VLLVGLLQFHFLNNKELQTVGAAQCNSNIPIEARVSVVTIGADFHTAMVATAPREKTPHRAPAREALDPTYDTRLVLCRKLHLLLGKSTKSAATRAALFDPNMHQVVCRLELRPRPAAGAYSAPPDL